MTLRYSPTPTKGRYENTAASRAERRSAFISGISGARPSGGVRTDADDRINDDYDPKKDAEE